jgi:hypothetical protein
MTKTNLYSHCSNQDIWTYKSCKAVVGLGEGWATIYVIESKERGKGHASVLLQQMKSYYENGNIVFGSTVALNDIMRHLLVKYNITEYV